MTATSTERLPISTEDDVVRVRHAVRRQAVDLRFSLIDQTKLVTAASELARNTLIHGGGGHAVLERVTSGARSGLRIVFEDHGPGIPDVQQALRDGFTTAGGLGLGLGGARRLVTEFSVESTVGVGTRIVIAKWK